MAKLNADGSALVYCTYVGGSSYDQGNGIGVDGAGNAYVAGMTSSSNFPTVNALQPASPGGGHTAFVAKIPALALSLLASAVTPTEGQSFTGVVAFFTDTTDSDPAAAYTALIAWGDGGSSSGTVVPFDGGFHVLGSHTYAEAGKYTMTVTVLDQDGQTVFGSQTATVADALLIGIGKSLAFVERQAETNVVASFEDADPRGGAGDYTAAIDWGDGFTTHGVITTDGALFDVTGTHTYVEEATYTISVKIDDADGATTTVSSTAIVAGTPNELFITQLYQDLLGRPVDAAGLAMWSSLLDQGVKRAQVVQEIENSDEYRGDEVEAAYGHLLQRQADAQGLAFFKDLLARGGTVEQMQAQVAGSTEYFQARAGGTNAGFLAALYHDALRRDSDAQGQAAFTQALAHGATRMQVASAIFSSLEYDQDLVGSLYEHYLRRMPDRYGLDSFTAALQHGARDNEVIAALAGSQEYFDQLF